MKEILRWIATSNRPYIIPSDVLPVFFKLLPRFEERIQKVRIQSRATLITFFVLGFLFGMTSGIIVCRIIFELSGRV